MGGMRLGRWPLAVETVVALTLARLAMVLPFRRVVQNQTTQPAAAVEASRPPLDPRAALIGRAVDKVGDRLPWRSSCLVRALAARALLRRRGIACVLHFGVGRDDDGFKAHAWLEAGGGHVCGGREAVGLVPLAGFGPEDRP